MTTILAYDPATSAMGYSVMEIIDRKYIKILDYGTIYGDQISKEQYKKKKEFGKTYSVLEALESYIGSQIETYGPTDIACERPYMKGFVNTFVCLELVFYIVKRAADRYLRKPPMRYAPKRVKLLAGAGGGSDKIGVRDALIANKNIIFATEELKKNFDVCLDHESDATAVGVTHAIENKLVDWV